jgi:hypothetical protein
VWPLVAFPWGVASVHLSMLMVWHRHGPSGGHRAHLCLRLAPGAVLEARHFLLAPAIRSNGPSPLSGDIASSLRLGPQERRHALTPSGFARGTPLLCSPPSRGDALVLIGVMTPNSTGTDGGSCIQEVLRSGEMSVRWCCVPKVGKPKSVNQLDLRLTLPTLRLEQTSPT